MLEELLRLNLFAFFLIFARIGTAIMFLPGFSATYISARFRLALALAISFVIFPVLAARFPVPPNALPDMGLMFVGEIIVGSFYGLILRALISSPSDGGDHRVIGILDGQCPNSRSHRRTAKFDYVRVPADHRRCPDICHRHASFDVARTVGNLRHV